PFKGNEAIYRAISRIIAENFECSESVPSDNPQKTHTLPIFIALATQRAAVHVNTAIAAVVLLNRLMIQSPTFQSRALYAGQGLFLAALSIATKFIHSESYGSRTWSTIGQLLFRTEDILVYEK
ncbi:hypothetical protein BDQ17DRAFT_1212311, partial [Cyathus striatus]